VAARHLVCLVDRPPRVKWALWIATIVSIRCSPSVVVEVPIQLGRDRGRLLLPRRINADLTGRKSGVSSGDYP